MTATSIKHAVESGKADGVTLDRVRRILNNTNSAIATEHGMTLLRAYVCQHAADMYDALLKRDVLLRCNLHTGDIVRDNETFTDGTLDDAIITATLTLVDEQAQGGEAPIIPVPQVLTMVLSALCASGKIPLQAGIRRRMLAQLGYPHSNAVVDTLIDLAMVMEGYIS